jgi:integrase/recombinase XerD
LGTESQIDHEVIEDLPAEFYRLIESCGYNTQTVNDYLISMRNEISISHNYKKITIKTLVYLSKFHSNKKFKGMKKQDILAFLNSKRRDEVSDPLHSWIATYNLYIIILTRFFKWVYHPHLPAKERPKPSCVEIPNLRRKEQSVYKPSDLWTQEDDLLFLKYCSSKRDRCYHAISRDSSCRPHELLRLKIKDVIFKVTGDRQYAEILVNGKTGQRHIPLINSLPYLKDWMDEHPQSSNPNAVLICGFYRSLGRPIRIDTINHIYSDYKNKIFPKLLDDPNVPSDDKDKIRELLKKRWNPYIRRHSALTEKSKILRESILRQHAGWSPTSNMHQKYVHYFGNESSESILEAYGLKPKLEDINKLQPTACPNCKELNKVGSKFCVKCRMVLFYDAYTEAIEDSELQKSRIDNLDLKFQELESKFKRHSITTNENKAAK